MKNGDFELLSDSNGIEQMRSNHMSFGEKLEEGQTNIFGKLASSIIDNCQEAMKFLDEFSV